MSEANNEKLEWVSSIVSAYVGSNPVPANALSDLIAQVHATLSALTNPAPAPEAEAPKPAVNPKKSIFPDYIVCLEDGQHFRSMKRHLGVHYNMTPAEYRAKWGLAPDYPMVAPNYSESRSALAKSLGLGRKPKIVSPVPSPAKRGRKPKVAA